MLVLSRHRDESIMIGDEIVVTIVDIRGDKVRLGIQAPTDIPVHRREVFDQHVCRDVREALGERGRRVVGANRLFRDREHRSRIESAIHSHQRNAGIRVALLDGGGDRAGAAVFREQ